MIINQCLVTVQYESRIRAKEKKSPFYRLLLDIIPCRVIICHPNLRAFAHAAHVYMIVQSTNTTCTLGVRVVCCLFFIEMTLNIPVNVRADLLKLQFLVYARQKLFVVRYVEYVHLEVHLRFGLSPQFERFVAFAHYEFLKKSSKCCCYYIMHNNNA